MSARILAVELRRSNGPLAGALVALAGFSGLYLLAATGQTALWDGQWAMLAGYQRIMLVVLWPLAVGAGGWHAGRDRAARTEELIGTTPRPRWRRVLPGSLVVAACLVAGYAAILAAGAGRVAARTSYVHAGWVPVALVGALSLAAAGLLGAGVARLVPSRYTPAALLLAGFAAVVLPPEALGWSGHGAALLLLPEFLDDMDEFTAVAGRVSAGQAVWFGALAVSGLALATVARRRWAWVAAVPAVAGLVVALAVLRPVAGSPLVPDARAGAEVCTHDGGPDVCVTRAHGKGLPALVEPARRALRSLSVLPDAPTSVHEVVRPGTQPAAQAWLSVGNFDPAQDTDEITARILAGAGTQFCPGSEHYRERAIVAAWLLRRYPAPGFEVPPGHEAAARDLAWRTLRALPADEQLQRIAAVRRAGLVCGDLTAALGGR
ncbi:hypothetical protein [Micromonospora avicenniae]|uniref:hypothetical protein n=1 Tax=Micromonospora avicenniae TaxID=1198245 RepID=UPI003319ED3E